MEISEARTLARSLMNQHNLHHVPFGFDNAKSRAGVTKYRAAMVNGRKVKTSVTKISLSTFYVKNHDMAKVRNTILHEIAHALDPEVGHGPSWARKCREVGIKPERCLDETDLVRQKAAWEAHCPACGTKAGEQHRAPLRVYMCAGASCKRLSRSAKRLVWTKNGQTVPVSAMPDRYQMEFRRYFA